MTNESIENFKKRHPRQTPIEEPPSRKRSGQIALLLMGTMAVGGGAYALMPSEKCDTTQPMTSEERLQCAQRNGSSSSGSHGYSGSGSSWGSSGSSSSSGRSNFASSSSSSSGLSAASSGSTHVARSGFGSFGLHFSGGG